MAGPVQPAVFPLMWAHEPSQSFLRTPAEMRGLIERAGFRLRAWDDITAEVAGPAMTPPPHAIQRLIMGEALSAITQAASRIARRDVS
jgi:hypothetical protein